jgi:hypothetical protein
MNNFIKHLAVICLITTASCKKENAHQPTPEREPMMNYIDLGNKTLSQNKVIAIDLDKDGHIDIVFHTILVGDAINKQDKLLYQVATGINTALSIDDNEETSRFGNEELISPEDMPNHHWYNIASITLMRKITGMTGDPFWEGNWREQKNQYLPFALSKNNHSYLGWIQLSTDIQNGIITFHKAALSVEAEKPIKAGH